MPNIQLANNLRYLRKQCGLTQTTLSDMLNIFRAQAYSNYETSKRTPDLDSLLLLASFYQVNLDALALKIFSTATPPAFCLKILLLTRLHREKNR